MRVIPRRQSAFKARKPAYDMEQNNALKKIGLDDSEEGSKLLPIR